MTLKKRIGKRLQAIRKKHGLSQQGVADQLEMSRAGYGNIELGRTDAPVTRLYLLADLYDIPVSSLLPRREKVKECAEETIKKNGNGTSLKGTAHA
jgi:transcriptional regulator with XRE-family HTH domain